MLVCTDLHASNILAARREPWLAIDPKPYDELQHLLNCVERVTADPAGAVHRTAGLLDLDADRLRQWLFARSVQEALDQPELWELAALLAPA